MLLAVRGNDLAGSIACKSLKSVGINIDNVFLETIKKTNINHIVHYLDGSFTDSRYSPITNECTVQFSNNLPTSIPSNLQNKEIYVILFRMFPINLDFIRNIPTKKVCLDIGSIGTIKDFDKEYLSDFLKEVSVLLVNRCVSDTLLKKMNLLDMRQLFNSLSLDLLIETNGPRSVNFIFKANDSSSVLTLQPNIIEKPLDVIGAGDAFFASIINAYSFCNNKKINIDSNFVKKVFPIANKLASEIVQINGCRGNRELYEKWLQGITGKPLPSHQIK